MQNSNLWFVKISLILFEIKYHTIVLVNAFQMTFTLNLIVHRRCLLSSFFMYILRAVDGLASIVAVQSGEPTNLEPLDKSILY
jgi:hypothetical protein